MPPNDRRARLVAKFRQVSSERLAVLLDGIASLEAKPDNQELSDRVKRELHTLKGEAKMLRLTEVGNIAHFVEEILLTALDDGSLSRTQEKLIEGLDLIAELIAESEAPPELLRRVNLFLGQPQEPPPPPPPSGTESGRDQRRARLLRKLREITPKRIAAIVEVIETSPELQDADDELKARIKREIHSLKGETRMMKLPLAGDVAARTEALIIEGTNGPLNTEAIAEGLVLIAELVNADEPLPPALVAKGEAFKSTVFDEDGESGASPAREPAPTQDSPELSQRQVFHEPAPPRTKASSGPSRAPEAPRVEGGGHDYVRVGTDHVVSMTDLAGELMVRHEQLERSLDDVERIALDLLAQVDVMRTSDGAGFRAAALAKVSAFGREILSTVARAGEEQFQNALHLSALQDEIRAIRMVRVSDLFNAHARSMRQLAREQGKLLRVQLIGEQVTVDKQVLDFLDEPLLHLCRNAVDHGLELPEIRAIAGKSQRGKIVMSAREVGGHVEVIISDDGRGVDPEAIRSAALRRGLIDESQANQLKGPQLLDLMFRPGFSTRQTASDISGRGVGLDVVSSQMGELGGSVSVESTIGAGTRFILRSPISTAFTRGLVVKAADALYAIPSTSVDSVTTIVESEIEVSGQGRSLKIDDVRLPLVSFSELLGAEARMIGGEGMVVIVENQGRMALLVDEVVGEREAVRRNLNAFVAGIDLVSGTGMIEGRKLVMFVNLQELYRLAGRQAGWKMKPATDKPKLAQRKSRVLVVDDSELTRDMLVSLLERLNFVVDEAIDGSDALHMLERHRPDLVMTDLDMPVMDGFGLLARIRESPTLKDLPVIVFSTRDSDEVKRRAMREGANAYLVKAAFRAEELNRTLRHYIRLAAENVTNA